LEEIEEEAGARSKPVLVRHPHRTDLRLPYMLVVLVLAALTPVIIAPGEIVEAYAICAVERLLLACLGSRV
jgi:hypothetical protein